MFSAHRWTMGIMTATTGVLLRKAETTAIGIMRRSCAPAMVVGCPRSLDMYQSRPPVALIPAATTKSTATVSSPSFANPSNPSSTVTTPAAMSTATAPIMTWSGWMMSHKRHPKATMTTQTVNHPSQTSAFSAIATDTRTRPADFTLLYGTLEARGGGAPGAERVSVSAVRIDERDRRAPTVRLILDTRALLERSR